MICNVNIMRNQLLYAFVSFCVCKLIFTMFCIMLDLYMLGTVDLK